jgi:hypothetical protein
VIVSAREKKVAISAGAAIALFIGYTVIWEPYTANLDDIDARHAVAAQQLQDDTSLFVKRDRLAKIWTAMQAHGLKTDQSQADSQLQHAILDWEQAAGVSQQTLKQDQPRKEGDFQVITYRVTATGGMRSIVRFVWALETAAIPVRLTDMRITPEKEGTDDLSVQLGVSTLSAPASAPAAPAAGAGAEAANQPHASAADY